MSLFDRLGQFDERYVDSLICNISLIEDMQKMIISRMLINTNIIKNADTSDASSEHKLTTYHAHVKSNLPEQPLQVLI